MTPVTNEELYKALKTLKTMCTAMNTCDDCPLCNGGFSDKCILSMENSQCPANWNLVPPDERYRPIAWN